MKSRRSMFRAMDWGQVCVKYSVVYTCQRRYPLFMKQKHSNGEKRFNLQSSMSIRIWLSLRQWLRDKIFSTIKVIPSPVSVCKNCKKNAFLWGWFWDLCAISYVIYAKHHGFNQRHVDNREYILLHYYCNYTSSSSSIRGRWSNNTVSWSQAMLTHACILGSLRTRFECEPWHHQMGAQHRPLGTQHHNPCGPGRESCKCFSNYLKAREEG